MGRLPGRPGVGEDTKRDAGERAGRQCVHERDRLLTDQVGLYFDFRKKRAVIDRAYSWKSRAQPVGAVYDRTFFVLGGLLYAHPEVDMKRFAIFALLVIAVFVAAVHLARSQSAGQGKWSEKARLPEPRGEVAVASVNGKIYVLGGSARGRDDQPLNEEYDPATDRWRQRAPMPVGLSHAGAVGMNGKVFVVGGFTRNVHMGALDVALEYDPARDNWRMLPPLKSPRGSVGVAALNGKIHAIGGRGVDTVTVATHEVYDPVTGRWSELAPLPKARDHLAVIAVDGRIHAIGGRFSGTADNTGMHDVYDPATNSWKSAAPLPTPRSAMAVTLYRNLIIVAGGECNNGKTFVENEAYDVKTDRWLSLAPMSVGRHGFRAVTLGEFAYFAGGAAGCGGGEISDTLLVFSLP